MDVHDLNFFATVARVGSITKAARTLATVQSNVTTRVRLLERELGVELFHRKHHGIQLTRKGRDLLPYAQQVIALMQKAREAVADGQEVRGALRIGSLQTTASARLPELLKGYVTQYNKVDIAIETGTTLELHEKVLNSDIEGAFIAGPVENPQLDAMVAFVEELAILTPAKFRSVEDYLAKGPIPKVLVFKAGCSYRHHLEGYLANEGIGTLNEMEFGTIDGIIGCVGAGVGMAMLPRSVLERSGRRKEVRIHPLPKKTSRVETLFITRRGEVRSSALERLMEVIKKQKSSSR